MHLRRFLELRILCLAIRPIESPCVQECTVLFSSTQTRYPTYFAELQFFNQTKINELRRFCIDLCTHFNQSECLAVQYLGLVRLYGENMSTLYKQKNCGKQIPALNYDKQNFDVNKPYTAVFVFDNLGAQTLLATVIQLSVQA